jgi:hypothetical protein
MKTPLIALLLLGPMLGGCVGTISAPATRDAENRADAAFAACDAQLRDGILKSHRQVVDCARPKVLAAYQENGYPNMDLVELDLYARGIGAERIDAGDASAAAVDRDLAELDRRIVAEQQRRVAARRATSGGASPVPLSQLLVGLNTLNARSAPPLPAPGKNCFAVGGFTHCQ